MGAPKEIVDLVHRFREQYDSYRLPSYGETELRREFIDPFFKALGWDIDNKQGSAEAYKDVVHENSNRSPRTLFFGFVSVLLIGDRCHLARYSTTIHEVQGFDGNAEMMPC
ncbi:MAG: hypothetical protein O3C40_09600 [Planctomycetota bacterium]|nr:hypothetical protein [Planctomycetota bacterium]